MRRENMCGKRIGTKLAAMIIAFALSITSFSGIVPGNVAYATNGADVEITDAANEDAAEVEISDEENAEAESVAEETSEDAAIITENDSESIYNGGDNSEVWDEIGIETEIDISTLDAELYLEPDECVENSSLETNILRTTSNDDISGVDDTVEVWGYLYGELGPEPVEIEFLEMEGYDANAHLWYRETGETVKATVVGNKYFADLKKGCSYNVKGNTSYYIIESTKEEEYHGDDMVCDLSIEGEDRKIHFDLKVTSKKDYTFTGSVYTDTGRSVDLSFELVFTDKENGEQRRVSVANGKFTATLTIDREYDVYLERLDSYASQKTFIPSMYGNHITVFQVMTIKGRVVGIEENDLEDFVNKAKFEFKRTTPSYYGKVYST